MIGLLERWGTFLAYNCPDTDTGVCFDRSGAPRATDSGDSCFAREPSVFTNLG